MSEQSVWTQVSSIVERYSSDEIMLDALLQWASNPTSMSAGYGLEENYPFIAKNLAVRFALSRQEAEKRVGELRNVCESLIQWVQCAETLSIEPRQQIGEIQRALVEVLREGEPARQLCEGVLRRLHEVSDEARGALLVFNLLEKVNSVISPHDLTKPPDYYSDRQSEFQAYHKSIFGNIMPTVRVVEEMVRCGAYNELYWVPSPRAKGSPGPTLVEAVVPTVEQIEATGIRLPPGPDIPALLESLWQKGDFGLLRLVDIVSHSHQGVLRVDEPLPVRANLPSFIGAHGQTVALSPVILAATKQNIDAIKFQNLEDCRRRVENALVVTANKIGADASLGVLWTGMGEVLWKLEVLKAPPLYVYLAPWLTTFAQSPGISRISLNEKPHVLFVIPYQARPSLLGCLERYSGFSPKDTRWDKSLGLLSDPQKPGDFQLIIGQRHPILDEMFAAIAGPSPQPVLPPRSPEPGPQPKPELSALAPVSFKVTFPPFAKDAPLVFGRGALRGKLAIGFREGSSFANEDVVTADLTDVNAGHIGIFMQIRGGKSTLASSIMLQAAFQGIPVLVVDPKPDYTSCLLPLSIGVKVASGFQEGARRRFELAKQDQRGFDLRQGLDFFEDGTQYRLRFQVVTFNRERAMLPGARTYRAPLVVLPQPNDPFLIEQCDEFATRLAGQVIAKPEEKGYNALLARILEAIGREDTARTHVLVGDVIDALQRVEVSGFGKKDTERLTQALRGYQTKTSLFFAAENQDVSNIADLMATTSDTNGRITVPITVVDVSELAPPLGRSKASPQREFISQLCGQIYQWLRSHRLGKPVELLLILDEAQNYLPNPADQYNYIRKLIHEGAAMGVKVIMSAQNPQQVDMAVRQQLKTFVVAKIPEGTIRYVVETFPLPHGWGERLVRSEEGQALVINEKSAPLGGILCNLFTSPQFVGFLTPTQVKTALSVQ